MFCPYCGTRNDDDARFCAECGNMLVSSIQKTTELEQQVVLSSQSEVKSSSSPMAVNSFMEYPLPEDTILKLPFQSFILKFIKLGTWSLLFFSIFFSWVFIRAKLSYFGYSMNESETANLFKLIFNSGSIAKGIGFLVFIGVLTMLVILGVIAIQVINMFTPKKIPVPQIVLCAAPAAITFIFMIVAWISMASVVSRLGLNTLGSGVTSGPGFGAWLVFILSTLETAAFILFMKGKNESIFKA